MTKDVVGIFETVSTMPSLLCLTEISKYSGSYFNRILKIKFKVIMDKLEKDQTKFLNFKVSETDGLSAHYWCSFFFNFWNVINSL